MARKPFVVIDAEILSSSVWSEAPHVRLVWLTLLILCDTDGYVGAAIPGIARAAGVSLEETRDAMERLQQPDPDSRTKTDEGRRVRLAERGFQILNFREHLDRLSAERAKCRDRVRKHRERKRAQADGNVTVPTGNRDQGEGTREKERTTDSVALAPVASAPPASWSKQACDDWIDRYGGTAPGGQIGKALKPLVAKHGWAEVRQAWRSYLEQTDGDYASPSRFASTYGRWSGSAPPGAKATAADRTRANLAAWVAGKEGA